MRILPISRNRYISVRVRRFLLAEDAVHPWYGNLSDTICEFLTATESNYPEIHLFMTGLLSPKHRK